MGRATEHTDIALTAEDALLIEDIYHKAAETYGESLEWADATRDDQIEIIGDDITCIAGNSLIAIDEHFDVYPCLYGAWGSTNIQWATCSEKTWQIYGVVSAGFHSEEEPS